MALQLNAMSLEICPSVECKVFAMADVPSSSCRPCPQKTGIYARRG